MNEVEQLALGLNRGESINGQICPKCGGGRNKDRSFSVTKSDDGHILYLCHRATCGYSGRIRTNVATTPTAVANGSTKKYAEAPEPRSPLSDATCLRIEDLYGIRSDVLDSLGIGEYNEWVCIPVVNRGMGFGPFWEYRLLPPYPNFARKSMHYRSEQLWLNDFENTSDVCIVVEDNWSAIKCWQADYSSVALMGTHMSSEAALYLATTYAKSDVVLCLDKDATDKAVGYVKKYGLLFNSLRFVPIDQDLKWKTTEQIRELIGGSTV